MDVLEIVADPARHPKIEDEELYTFLNQFLVKHKSFNILNTAQEAAVCDAIKRRYRTTPPPQKTRDLVNKLDMQRTSEEDKKAALADLFKRGQPAATQSVDAVKEIYRRKGVVQGSTALTESDILPVIKYMCTTFSDFEFRQEQSWNAENFGKVTAQMVCPHPCYLMLVTFTRLVVDTRGAGSFKFPLSGLGAIPLSSDYLSWSRQGTCVSVENTP
jgi:hypothetical protein